MMGALSMAPRSRLGMLRGKIQMDDYGHT
jgi:hypothetical protein